MPLQPIRLTAQGVADASGTVVLNFDSTPSNLAWTGSVSIPDSASTASWTAQIGTFGSGLPVGSWVGRTPFGPLQTRQGETLSLHATGLLTGQSVQAVWVGYSDDADNVLPVTPNSMPSSTVSTSQQSVVIYPSTPRVVPANSLVSAVFSTSQIFDTNVIEATVPGNCELGAEITGLNGSVVAFPTSLAFVTEEHVIPFRSLGGTVTVQMRNLDNVPHTFLLAIRGFIGISVLDISRPQVQNILNVLVAPGANSPLSVVTQAADYDRIAYLFTSSQAFTPYVRFAFPDITGSAIDTVDIPLRASGAVSFVDELASAAPGVAFYAHNDSGVQASVKISSRAYRTST